MSRASSTRHHTLSLPFHDRASLPETPPLTAYLYRLMAVKRTNLCLSADVQTTSQLLELAEECGDSICVLKTHADIISDFGERTIKGLTAIAIRKKFLIFEDRKFGDIGSTVQVQYGAGHHRIASWASIINAHIFPGPAVITSLRSAAFSAVSAYNSVITTEITGGRSARSNGYFDHDENGANGDEDEEADEEEDEEERESASSDDDSDSDAYSSEENTTARSPPRKHRSSYSSQNGPGRSFQCLRKDSVVSINTTISSSAEYISPSLSDSSAPFDPRPPLSRGLLLIAQMSSADNLCTPAYTARCVELARQHKDFVLGFIAQEGLNSAPMDNFLVMTPGVSLPPVAVASSSSSSSRYSTSPGAPRLQTRPTASSSRQAQPSRSSVAKQGPTPLPGDGMGQQYNTPRHLVLDKGVDVIIVGRGILNADDRALEALRYRREGWRAVMERCGGKG